MEPVMGSLLTKLGELVNDEYNQHKVLKKDVKFLKRELRSIHAALRMLGMVPPDQVSESEKYRANRLRELAYDVEDVLDAFMVHTEMEIQPANLYSRFNKTTKRLFVKLKTRHQIASAIKEIKLRSLELDEMRRYRIDEPAARSSTAADPRLVIAALHGKAAALVGIEDARDDLIERLVGGDGVPNQPLKIVSLVGFGGLGKTTLAKVVYDKLRLQFDCHAFVSLSPNPDMKKVLKDMIHTFGMEMSQVFSWDLTKLVDELRQFLQDKRYLVVIDDIWDKKSWQAIKPAMAGNNLGSIIITTTRNFEVSEEVGGAYKLKLLSPGNSQKLFYRRVFGEVKCPDDDQLTEISDKFLNKCCGLPLAIVAIAGILASMPMEVLAWCEVYKSIGSALQVENELLENMRRVLLYSYYYDLPFHLRPCLLYISIFPEDFEIRRDRLVWRWIAEGFVQEREGTTLFEVGQNYFTELSNRGIIQGVDSNDDDDGMVKYCRVHTVMLGAIRSLTDKQNFVTILNEEEEHTISDLRVRRLSLQSNMAEGATSQEVATRQMSQVRSVTAFGSGINEMPALWRFEVLRVMDLEGCVLEQSYSLDHIGKLLQLRYLGLRGTLIAELPMKIGNLQFLQILDLARTKIKELQSSVALLQRLMCLYVDHMTRLPDRLGKLTSLEEVSKVSTSESPDFVKQLHKLTKLRTLGIVWHEMEESLEKQLLETLSNLLKMQTLRVYARSESVLDAMGGGGSSGWVPPPDLQTFVVTDGYFSVLPAWITTAKPNSLKLTELDIGVKELRQEDVEALGMLEDLRSLRLAVERSTRPETRRKILLQVGAGAFPRLRKMRFQSETCQLTFQPGAAPKLEILEFLVNVGTHGLNWGLGNLPSLEELHVGLSMCTDARSQEQAEAALRHTASIHPNRPTLEFNIIPSSEVQEVDDQLSIQEPGNISNDNITPIIEEREPGNISTTPEIEEWSGSVHTTS